ncbi:hypothetical protein RchiOBHm_Chr6g0275121 [Rosa chinensis]|uniref:Uncharacterized protein n=1 Tax=Rosa chinensis TaxID=74649 RepID=A0A2P6PRZ4_ROSCH|nr:hypothetical protein RchiOBHm_Chr6g0275121 [Rosa chinensis]
MPAIDEMYYKNEIRHFTEELKAMGVVDNATATEKIAAQFSSLLSSSNWLPANVMSLLGCIRELSQTMFLHHPELKWLLCEKWLKTRHGYKGPCESIIFSSQWGSISLFVDLPLIDDVYYGIGIYKYRDELEKLGVITDFEGGAVIVAKGLSCPIEDELITADGILSLLECLKCLMTRSPDEPSLSNFLKNIAKTKCLKTQNGYKLPEECVLFDPAWEGILKPSVAPTIDENFYRTDISVYKKQLRDIGVKVYSLDVCSLLSWILFSLTETTSITRIYSFLNKFQWNPEVLDNLMSQVWIPTPKGTGKWINSQDCVLHDNKHVFGSRLFSLDEFYKKELLPLFSSAFGVTWSYGTAGL